MATYSTTEHVLKASRTYMVASASAALPTVAEEATGEWFDRDDWSSCVSTCMSSPSCAGVVRKDFGPGVTPGCRMYIPAPTSRHLWRRLSHADTAPPNGEGRAQSWVKFVASNSTGGGFVPRGEMAIARASEGASHVVMALSTPSCARACENDNACIAFVQQGMRCYLLPSPPTLAHADKFLPANERATLYSTCNRAIDDHLNLDVRSNPLLLYPIVATAASIVVAGIVLAALPRRSRGEHVPEAADEILWEDDA